MTDSVESMSKKVNRAISGGKSTVEEHRRLGGDCSKDISFQYLKFFFEQEDSAIAEIRRDYESGRMLAGEIKKLCIDKASMWLEEISEKRSTGEIEPMSSSLMTRPNYSLETSKTGYTGPGSNSLASSSEISEDTASSCRI